MTSQRILITGAAKGIGEGIARCFAKEHARLFLHFRSDPAAARRLAEELRESAAEVILHQADLADERQLREMFDHLEKEWQGLDAAINNAGWDPGYVPLTEIDSALYYKLTDMNIKGTLFCCLNEIRIMRKYHQRGAIVNLGSVQQDTTVPGRTLYAMSKGAIHSLTAQLALETGADGIRVNCIAPGYVEVPRMVEQPGYESAAEGAKIPIQRTGKTEDVGNFAVFLASDKASFIHGQTLVIDGGVSCRLARFKP